MEKATGCSSLSVNIQQKKRVRFFLDTVGWEGGLLKLQSLPCAVGRCCRGSRRWQPGLGAGTANARPVGGSVVAGPVS